MAISSGFTKVFDIGTYFRSERSSTNRHLTEFVTLNVEMELKYHYNEVMDLVDGLFADIFMQVNQSCANQLDAIAKQYPFEPLKFLPNTLRISFERGVQMHEESGEKIEAHFVGSKLRETDMKNDITVEPRRV
ncbi:aspartate--tRNA ligase 2, cytoplasmic [Arabidopsis lyrata subsp. lyrata]|uniref:aspartate--tRNA ligase 2, cytoplasmic n=1 Tax=Arabidopsis lyrata subsp. lyrata TaxID=81972 RepID=UPI000A29E8BB|nr:aspartate--tRNA ligase 2, cytoplasmic [Arabidopsis lyrata subsp. lyrata]|eukprot:XP_020875046.1 aspartate--tRNA ligase 2, cytoplasmic [Arabidopsis lyrata subsp. lyrata]